MQIDFEVRTELSRSGRVRQLEAMFDLPPEEKSHLTWKGEVPIEKMNWNVGLIVGPSGCGKTSIARQMFKDHFQPDVDWTAPSVIDDFSKSINMQQISETCQAVGFNTIPAWLRPYAVLSNGEKFRVELARRLLELPSPVVVDEFTSVVDRQVAQIGSHAVQKFVRRTGKQFVAVSCHYDIVDWLQPDWILEPSTMAFTPRGSLQRRPTLDVTISRVPYAAWKLFSPFHYLSADLHRGARCFCLFVGDRPAAFGAALYRPHPKADDIMGLSRLVTLPDWQGLGLAMILAEKLGAAYKAVGRRFHTYPAHPALVRSFDKSPLWQMEKKPGTFAHLSGKQSAETRADAKANPEKYKQATVRRGSFGGRPCAMFSYKGSALPLEEAQRLLAQAIKV